MISEKIEKALNEQINKEMSSSYLYLGMAVHFEAEGLPGFASWMKKQAHEEMEHAMKIYDFLFAAGGKPVLGNIGAVKTKYGEPLEVFQAVLTHEKYVTSLITDLYELSLAEKDYKTQNFLQFFISEQVEEEASVQAIIDRFKFIQNNCGLLLLDKELGAR